MTAVVLLEVVIVLLVRQEYISWDGSIPSTLKTAIMRDRLLCYSLYMRRLVNEVQYGDLFHRSMGEEVDARTKAAYLTGEAIMIRDTAVMRWSGLFSPTTPCNGNNINDRALNFIYEYGSIPDIWHVSVVKKSSIAIFI